MLGDTGGAWVTRLHMIVAKNLLSSNWSQAEVATILGTTQSTISRQIQRPLPELAGSADEITVDKWADDLSKALVLSGPTAEVVRQRFVTEFQLTGNQILRYDTTLTGMDLDEDQIKTALLRRLEWSCNRLSLDIIEDFLPAVGMNIAACTADAESIDDVCAFPGRLAAVSGTIRPIEPAAYGSSNHLANILLRARKRDSNKGAILNLRPMMKRASDTEVNQKAVAKACDSLEWTSTTASRGVVALDTEFVDVIIDAGDFGWEPTLYVLANNPLELVERTHTFLAALA